MFDQNLFHCIRDWLSVYENTVLKIYSNGKRRVNMLE